MERRHHWRIPVGYRVDYRLDTHRVISYTSNLSLGGMLLRSADALTPGQLVQFAINVNGATEVPLRLQGRVLETHDAHAKGVRVQFVTSEDTDLDRLQDHFESALLSQWERAREVLRPPAQKLTDLIALYIEANRYDDALDTLEDGLAVNPDPCELHRQAIPYLLLRVAHLEDWPREQRRWLLRLKGQIDALRRNQETPIFEELDEKTKEALTDVRRREDAAAAKVIERRIEAAVVERTQALRARIAQLEKTAPSLPAPKNDGELEARAFENERAQWRKHRADLQLHFNSQQEQLKQDRRTLHQERQALDRARKDIEKERGQLSAERQALHTLRERLRSEREQLALERVDVSSETSALPRTTVVKSPLQLLDRLFLDS